MTPARLREIRERHETDWVEAIPNEVPESTLQRHHDRAALLEYVADLERGRDIQKGNAERWERLAMTYKQRLADLTAALESAPRPGLDDSRRVWHWWNETRRDALKGANHDAG